MKRISEDRFNTKMIYSVVSQLLCIRDDMCLLFKRGASLILTDKSSKNLYDTRKSHWILNVKRSADYARNYDPHKKIQIHIDKEIEQFSYANVLSDCISRSIKKFNWVCNLVIIIGAGSYILNVDTMLNFYRINVPFMDIDSILRILGLVTLFIKFVVWALKKYSNYINRDTELIRNINTNVVYDVEANSRCDVSTLIAMTIWNSQLRNYNQFCGSLFIAIIRTISNKMYYAIVLELGHIISRYVIRSRNEISLKTKSREWIANEYIKNGRFCVLRHNLKESATQLEYRFNNEQL
ncbi:hypothetical protein MSLAZ_2334 [Methanosarcina lacustris Z-7289]|uniref:Uncharacterized protein n=1 Tax=Methanosarcina lacustris Z-7289 TaxID=1434111 RepID=A0A0E3WS28_9EURY|nr:hypothetical protein [Methanosarcina lacustris]AKB75595.1 hypothetical protein MSLAZ_2334 [Methanosarcina lacustris Z-7289]